MPRLWTETIEEHRRAVRDATLDATAALVAELGLPSVTMSQIAHRAGIGRATLYKYFPDVDAILLAWHERHVAHHLEHLEAVRAEHEDPRARLRAVLRALGSINSGHPHSELAVHLHQGAHVADAQRKLTTLVDQVLAAAVEPGNLRADVPIEELGAFCLQAMAGANKLSSPEAVERLVVLVMAGLQYGAGNS